VSSLPPRAAPVEAERRREDFEVERVGASSSSLLDAVDRLIDKGAMLKGDVVLAIANVDLVRLDLNLLLAAVETLEAAEERRGRLRAGQAATERRTENRELGTGNWELGIRAEAEPRPIRTEVPADCGASREGSRAASVPGSQFPVPSSPFAVSESASSECEQDVNKPAKRIALDPKDASKGVAKLVLTLVEFVRQLLERQAIRRMEGGRLADEAVEGMGEALLRLEAKVREMKDAFGLAGEDLDLDLGPLGKLNGPGASGHQRSE
jgi:hypothetical protein